MSLSIDRGMVVQAVLQGQIGIEHVTIDELITAHHILADTALAQALLERVNRGDVVGFALDYNYDCPH